MPSLWDLEKGLCLFVVSSVWLWRPQQTEDSLWKSKNTWKPEGMTTTVEQNFSLIHQEINEKNMQGQGGGCSDGTRSQVTALKPSLFLVVFLYVLWTSQWGQCVSWVVKVWWCGSGARFRETRGVALSVKSACCASVRECLLCKREHRRSYPQAAT